MKKRIDMKYKITKFKSGLSDNLESVIEKLTEVKFPMVVESTGQTDAAGRPIVGFPNGSEARLNLFEWDVI